MSLQGLREGIGKSTLHYLRKKATGEDSFRVYATVDWRVNKAAS